MDNNLVPISDFKLFSFLVAKDLPLVDYRRNNHGKVDFLFAESENFRKAIKEFRFGDDTVSARKFLAAQGRLREIIFDDEGLKTAKEASRKIWKGKEQEEG